MTATTDNIPDFSDLTCTNLMIRLKMLLKKTPSGTPVECYVRRDQKDTVEVPFSRSGYIVEIRKAGTNRYRVSLTKSGQEPATGRIEG
jgi:hypothetical protein